MKKKNRRSLQVSQESEGQTSDLSGPDLELFDTVSLNHSRAGSSNATGPQLNIGPIFPCLLAMREGCEGGGKGPLIQEEISGALATHNIQTLEERLGPQAYDVMAGGTLSGEAYPTIQAQGHRANDNGILAVEINQRREAGFSPHVMGAMNCAGGQSSTQVQAILSNEQTLSGEARPAKTSLSPEREKDSQGQGQDFSISGKISSRRIAQDTLLSWSKSQDYLVATEGGILPPFLVPSPGGSLLSLEMGGAILAYAADRSGLSHGALLTLDTLEWPKDGEECFLPQILEKQIPPKYYGSQQYCLGILRRSARRGIAFAGQLRGALAIRAVTPLPNNSWLELLRRQEPAPPELLDKATKLISALWPQHSEDVGLDLTQEVTRAWGLSVRRLTPTETLTLQGFPKDWCDLPIPASTMLRGTQSALTSRTGSAGGATRRFGGKRK